jgi:hypothetical protein
MTESVHVPEGRRYAFIHFMNLLSLVAIKCMVMNCGESLTTRWQWFVKIVRSAGYSLVIDANPLWSNITVITHWKDPVYLGLR